MFKKILTIITLTFIFSYQSSIKAEDIKDYEIVGISIRDNIEKFLSKSQIKSFKKSVFKNEKFITLQFDASVLNSDQYEMIEINYQNPNLIVESIAGIINFKDVKKCYKQQDKIISEMRDVFLNNSDIKFISKETFEHLADKTGKSTFTRASFKFSNGDVPFTIIRRLNELSLVLIASPIKNCFFWLTTSSL